jgi:tetratricopeptide (TPR) repeat protein
MRQVKEGIVIEGVQTRTRQSATLQLGERVRQLRVAAGLTQTDLAGDRFSKEYISQIERGKTRPTQDTIDWLATRLSVDAGYLANGVETADLARAEALLAQGEALISASKHEEAAALLEGATQTVAATGLTELTMRRQMAHAWALMEGDEVRKAVDLLVDMQTWPSFIDLADHSRAEFLFRLGVGRVKLGSTHVALSLLTEAHKLAGELIGEETLVARILSWRSVCLQRLNDVDLAREDAEHALELSERSGDPRLVANALFQASLTAWREGRYAAARRYAERAGATYEELEDQVQLGKILNNLGGVSFETRDFDKALAYFKRAYACQLDAGRDDQAALVICSIASTHLELGDPVKAEEQARLALATFGDTEVLDHEIGETHYYLGQALMAQSRLDDAAEAFAESERVLERVGAASVLARTILAQGDLASVRGDETSAARLYRHSAELLQDIHF